MPIQNICKLSYDDWYTEKRIITDSEYQVDIGSAQSVNSTKCLICAHQTDTRSNIPYKLEITAIFDQLDAGKNFVEIDGQLYQRDSVFINYTANDYIDQYGDLKKFYKEYVGEELMSPFISYPDMTTNYPSQVIDLRFQIDHNIPREVQLFEEYRVATPKARLFVILIKRRGIELMSDGEKLIVVRVSKIRKF